MFVSGLFLILQHILCWHFAQLNENEILLVVRQYDPISPQLLSWAFAVLNKNEIFFPFRQCGPIYLQLLWELFKFK